MADFLWKVSHKMLNLADNNNFSHLKSLIFRRHNASFEILISKVQNF